MEEGQESKPVEQKPVQQTEKREVQKERKPGIFSRLANRLIGYRRVLEISSKPDREELVSSIKVTLLGIALLGGVGFAIFLAYFLVF